MSENKEEIIKFNGKGLSKAERYWAQKQFNTYQQAYHIEQHSDLQLLEDLIFREALQNRLKEKIGTLAEGKEKGKEEIVPSYLLKALDENSERTLVLREKLGLFENKKENDSFQYIQMLKRKFKVWREEHQASRYVKCPFCSQSILLKIKADIYDAIKHPFFCDNILGSPHLVKLYKEKKIDKTDVSKILGTSPDYVEWLISKWDRVSPT